MLVPGDPWLASLGMGATAFLLGYLLAAQRARKKRQAAEQVRARLAAASNALSREREREREERQRVARREEELSRTVARLPWLAKDLLECHETRLMPARALDLIEELFSPRYSVFLMARRGGFLVTHVRGDAPYALHACIGPQQGVVAWAAAKQLVLTPQDAASETTLVKDRYLSGKEVLFDFCIPVAAGRKTIAVLLVGPSQRSLPSALDFARIVGVMVTVSMKSAQALADQRRLAETDGLTGLLNKKRISDHLQHVLFRSEKGERGLEPLGVFLFDIDHFKQFNDRNGHPAGDELLRSLSALLRRVTREDEVLGRWGGEEFLLLMPNATKQQALRGAERLRAAIASHPFACGEGQPGGRVSISGGVAVFPEDGRQPADLISAADHALYEAKRQGRNRVLAFQSTQRVMTQEGGVEAKPDDDSSGVIELGDALG